MKVRITQPSTRLIPVTKWLDFHVWPTTSSLRRMIRKGKETGFERCVIRIGKRLLIDEKKFFEWVHAQQQTEEMNEEF